MNTRLAGAYAAVLTPRTSLGDLDRDAFGKQLGGIDGVGLRGFAVNGATGEFTVSTPQEVELLVRDVRSQCPTRTVLCGIGSGSLRQTLELGRAAIGAGSDCLLLPMPYFFPYQSGDLEEFVSQVAGSLESEILLYNLPQFTSGLEPETVVRLLKKHRNLIGIKDSSGGLSIVRALTEQLPSAVRLMGNDGALCDAMREGLCDGVVSGVACALPELIAALFADPVGSEAFANAENILLDFLRELDAFPTPWGLKIVSGARGWTKPWFPLPLSECRHAQAEKLARWTNEVYANAIHTLRGAL